MNRRTLLGGVALAAILLVVAFSGTGAAHGGDDGTHHHDGAVGTHSGMGWGLWPVLALVLAAAGVYVLVARADGPEDSGGADDAVAVLRERYARGEIDDEEFERRRRQLGDS